MRLTPATIEVLKNFSTINQSILFKPGKTLRTISPQKNVFGEAEVVEEFPLECAIYELPKLLAILPLFENADITFEENYLVVSSPKSTQKIKYFYASKNLITAPPDKNLVMSEMSDQFTLSQEDIGRIQKVSGIMQLPHIVLSASGGKRTIGATNKKSKSSNDSVIDLGLTDAEDYEFVLKNDNIKLLPGAYTVEVGYVKQTGIVRFITEREQFEVHVNDKLFAIYDTPEAAKEGKEKVEASGKAKSVTVESSFRTIVYFIGVESNF